VVEDAHDPEEALRRAARTLGIRLHPGWPRREELSAAIREYRQMFRPRQAVTLLEKRRLALEAMKEFADFRPKLFGDLLTGDGPLDRIRLMLTADSAEQVIYQLADRHIPWQETEAILIHSGGRKKPWPAMRFLAGDTTVELVVMDHVTWSDPPIDAFSGRPLQMAGAEQLGALIDRDETP